jgi:N-acetyl-1-D-myo-inositol-2-amino-2-deoxy-alpha-D-glucopyranoside deacetylase
MLACRIDLVELWVDSAEHTARGMLGDGRQPRDREEERMRNGLLCVHAHPDDEAISTGGVLLRAADRGFDTAVVTCTAGERGEIAGEGLDPEEVRPRLGEVRRAELAAALAVLGAGEPRLLGYRDSGMLGDKGNADPRSFWQADFDEAVGRLVAQIRALRPAVLVTYDAFGLYGHPDHVQAHRVALVAAEAAAVPALHPAAGDPWRVTKVYQATVPRSFTRALHAALMARGLPSPFAPEGGIPVGSPDDLVTTVVDVRAVVERKLAALHAHRSQLGPDSLFLNVPDDLVEAAFGTEWFVRQRSDVAVPHTEDDLMTGLPASSRGAPQTPGGFRSRCLPSGGTT